MKKYIYMMMVPFILLAGCTDDKETIEPPTGEVTFEEASIELSEHVIVFGSGETRKSVAVASSIDEWEIVNESQWLSAVRDGNSLVITKTGEPGDDETSTFVSVAARDGEGNEVSDKLYVGVKLGSSYKDLTGDEPANCYIAPTGGNYTFDARVKGNGSDRDGNSRYLSIYGLYLEDAAYAELLWESTFNGDKTRSSRIIDGNPVLKDGLVHFSTGTEQGNALIAVKDLEGNVLWSWHIWVVDDEPTAVNLKGLWIMDRNLGAITNTPADINNKGLFYQWGRKDPFLPSPEEYYLVASDRRPHNTQTGNGSGVWQYEEKPLEYGSLPGNMPRAVANPMMLMSKYGGILSYYDDWCMVGAEGADARYSYLWGKPDDMELKSIFDPCPAGYAVPAGSQLDFGLWYKAPDGEYGLYWEDLYFPGAGCLVGSSGVATYEGSTATLWSTTPYGDNKAMRMMVSTKDELSVGYTEYSRCSSYSVRCVKI